jgi:hypothetical protein
MERNRFAANEAHKFILLKDTDETFNPQDYENDAYN